MDFFDLYYYTDRVLYKTVFHDWQHPSPVKRKNRLLVVADKDEYDFNTVDGNHLYSGFLEKISTDGLSAVSIHCFRYRNAVFIFNADILEELVLAMKRQLCVAFGIKN